MQTAKSSPHWPTPKNWPANTAWQLFGKSRTSGGGRTVVSTDDATTKPLVTSKAPAMSNIEPATLSKQATTEHSDGGFFNLFLHG
ncbi:MAG: hypothetical protein ACYDCK_09735 [Thermoplasmatota archaeon]